MNFRFVALGLVILTSGLSPAAKGRSITYDDLYSISSCRDPQISPDGKKIIYILRTGDPKENVQKDRIWIMNADGTGAVSLYSDTVNQSSPRWSPDGTEIYFLSRRDASGVQVWMIPAAGGEPRRVTSIPTAVAAFSCYPSGGKLLVVSRVFADCSGDSCNQAALDADKSWPDKPKLFDRLLFRHYNRWRDGRVNRIMVVNTADGAHEELKTGEFDAPTSCLGGDGDLAPSPDGKEICFAMTTDSVPAVWPNNDLYLADEAGGQIRHFTTNPGLETAPEYSPDGKYLSYLGTARAGYESDQRDLMVYDRKSKSTRNLTESFDRSVSEYSWDGKSQYIYFVATDCGFDKIWRVGVRSGKVELVLGDAEYGDLHLSPDGKFLVVSRSQSNQPAELYRYDIGAKRLLQLTSVTSAAVQGVEMRRAETFWFRGTNGDSVQGFLTLPVDFDAQKKYPLVLLIHGGPQFAWSEGFNFYGWNTQLTAAQGYVVAQINPHGSSGYGVKFQDYVSGNWGKGDFDDLMTGVDTLLAKFPYLDSTRTAALGRSYGGFMTNWICGHTNRFKCLVTIDGTYDHLADYGSTDELWFPEWEMKGTPWSNREEYIRSSPATYASSFRTPTLIIHGQRDYRVDLSEGLQMFTALKRQGVEAELLYLPNEGHYATRLDNARIIYQRQFEWLARWLK